MRSGAVAPTFPKQSPYYTTPHNRNVNRPAPNISVFDAVTDTLDLSAGGRDLLNTMATLSPAGQAEYLEILANLFKAGVVGTETLRVNGRPYQTFATTRFADPDLARAPQYR